MTPPQYIVADGLPIVSRQHTRSTDLLDSFSHAVYMVNGRVAECGRKEDLLARKGHFYRRMVQQSGLFIDDRGRAHISPERLRQVWLFANAPILSLQALTKLFMTRSVIAGEAIYKQGTESEAMYMLVSGTIELAADDGGAHQIFQMGDDFGIEAFLDGLAGSTWQATARVVSPKAVLLELSQEDMKKQLNIDPGLAESLGETLNEISRMRSPKRLGMLWPFFGASESDLELISAELEPTVYDPEAVICASPNDPCTSMHMIVMGAVNTLHYFGDSKRTEKLTRGAVFGTGEVLPSPPAGTAQALIRSKQCTLRRVQATEATVTLEVTRESLDALMRRQPSLRSAYDSNISRWLQAIQPARLSQHWLFATCPPESLARLAPLWTPLTAQEGSRIVELGVSSDRCLIVLAGRLMVRTRREGGSADSYHPQHVEAVEEGGVINSVALLGGSANEVGEVSVVVEVVEPALLLSLSAASFQGVFSRISKWTRTAEAASPPARSSARASFSTSLLDELDELARRRMLMLTTDGLRAKLHADESVMSDAELNALIMRAATDAFEDTDVVLSSPRSHAAAQQAESRWSRKSSSGQESDSSRRTSMIAPASGHHSSRQFDEWGLDQTLYVIISGELVVELPDGTGETLGEGAAFVTPLPASTAQMLKAATVVVDARSASSGAVVLRFEIGDISADALAAEAALVAEREAREASLAQVATTRQRVAQLELRMGFREWKEPRRLWSWAFARLRCSLAFGLEPDGVAHGISQMGGGSLEEELAALQQVRSAPVAHSCSICYGSISFHACAAPLTHSRGSILKTLLQRVITLDQLVVEREVILRKTIEKWEELQPAVLPEEASLGLDTDMFDLSLGRLAEGGALVKRLQEMRLDKRDALESQLKRKWQRAGVEADEQERILAAAPGIDARSLHALLSELGGNSSAAEGEMLELQARLHDAWDVLAFPDAMRAPFQWTPGAALDDDLLEQCRGEADKLELFAKAVKPLLQDSPSSAALVGQVFGLMQTMPTAPAAGTSEGHGYELGTSSSGHDGASTEAAAKRASAEAAREWERAEAAERERAMAKQIRDLEKRLHHAETRTREEEEHAGGGELERSEQYEAAQARIFELEQAYGKLKLRLQVELAAKDDEKTEAVRLAAAKGERLRKMELITHTLQRDRILETRKDQTTKKQLQADDTAAFEELLEKRRALVHEAMRALELLSAGGALRDEFEAKHNHSLVHPDRADKGDIRKLSTALEQLRHVLERLTMRCESDGLFVALRQLLKSNQWKPKQLAEQMVKGPSALKEKDAKPDEITGAQIDYFMQRKQITFTPTAFAFFVQKCGSSVKKLQSPKGALKAEAFVRAFESVVTPPITL